MVKSTFLLASAASLYLTSLASVQAQATPTLDISSLAAEASNALGSIDFSSVAAQASSLMNNPTAISSLVAQASNAVSLLPSEYQSSAAAAVAAASSSLAASKDGKSSDASVPYKPLGAVAFVAAIAGAAVLM